jgi:hypothetical protein
MGYSNDDMTPHGFRAMARTIMVEQLDIHPDVIEAQLAHSKSGPLGAAYDRAEFMTQRRVMMATWADHLEHLARVCRPRRSTPCDKPRASGASLWGRHSQFREPAMPLKMQGPLKDAFKDIGSLKEWQAASIKWHKSDRQLWRHISEVTPEELIAELPHKYIYCLETNPNIQSAESDFGLVTSSHSGTPVRGQYFWVRGVDACRCT